MAHRHFSSGGMKILVDVYSPKRPLRGLIRRFSSCTARAGCFSTDPRCRGWRKTSRRPDLRLARCIILTGPPPGLRGRRCSYCCSQPGERRCTMQWNGWRTLHPEARSVGIFGYSLGAFAAVEEARRHSAVGVVVAQAGGFWHAEPEGPTRRPMPPRLIIHGLKDQRVPFAKYTQPCRPCFSSSKGC